MSKQRFSLIVDVHLFLIKDNKILLLLRKNTGYMDDFYHVPAGHLDGEERIVDALIRESKEEAGLDIKAEDVKFVHVMHHKSNNERAAFFFEVEKWQGEIQNMELDKCAGLEWFPLSSLPDNIVPYVKEAIKHYLDKEIFSHYGWENETN